MSSHNEWDPLEEVIVGTIEGVTIPPLTHEMKSMVRRDYWDFYRAHAGEPYPEHLVRGASKALDNLQRVLEDEGVAVTRPGPVDYATTSFRTPYFESTGFFNADVRDVLLVVGDEVIEAPMALPPRYFEHAKYQPLLQQYFERGARWTAAPKCSMGRHMYDDDYPEEHLELFRGEPGVPDDVGPLRGRFMTTEAEPCFDAADFSRFGRDIVAQRSQVTNELGIRWLERHLGSEYRVHRARFRSSGPVHIDTTWVPLGEGRVLTCPARPCLSPELVDMFKRAGWEIIEAPEGVAPAEFQLSSRWLSMNLLVIDEQRVVVDKHEEPTITMLRSLGIRPVLVDFKDHYVFGGGLHCATLDVRRRGTLRSYFD
ncbi:amidinotransferase [Streptomyces sp. NPDC050560]|uniref:amidinotransferase n=1 Tax=Streptomyces sp. NPDC050560 TaxID=3365630 RepID=UPI0037A12553